MDIILPSCEVDYRFGTLVNVYLNERSSQRKSTQEHALISEEQTRPAFSGQPSTDQ